MTFYRKDPDSIRNWYDVLVDGIGHRGSSFCDLDAIETAPALMTHNREGDRHLIVELKHENERLTKGQEEALRSLATKSSIDVWLVIRNRDDTIGWYDFAWSESIAPQRLARGDFRDKFHRWWNHRITKVEVAPVAEAQVVEFDATTFTANRIRW